jgi:plasmid stabilization system protein ParE
MKALLWSIPAEADLAGIDDYWFGLDRDQADRLLDRIEQAAERLRFLPEGGPIIGNDTTRKWRVAGAPYILLYRVRSDAIEILRVHHARQDWRPE